MQDRQVDDKQQRPGLACDIQPDDARIMHIIAMQRESQIEGRRKHHLSNDSRGRKTCHRLAYHLFILYMSLQSPTGAGKGSWTYLP